MKIFLISQSENNDYDTYDSAVVIAEDEESARKIHPSMDSFYEYPWGKWPTWASSPDFVTVEYIGEAKKDSVKCVICASYNAG